MESKVVGLNIPDDCSHVYIFSDKDNFTAQIASGKMKPLYGEEEFQNEYMGLYIAYIPTDATG